MAIPHAQSIYRPARAPHIIGRAVLIGVLLALMAGACLTTLGIVWLLTQLLTFVFPGFQWW